MVFPVPGSPATMMLDAVGNPPPRISSSSRLPVLRVAGLTTRHTPTGQRCSPTHPHAAGAQSAPQPLYGAGHLGGKSLVFTSRPNGPATGLGGSALAKGGWWLYQSGTPQRWE